MRVERKFAIRRDRKRDRDLVTTEGTKVGLETGYVDPRAFGS